MPKKIRNLTPEENQLRQLEHFLDSQFPLVRESDYVATPTPVSRAIRILNQTKQETDLRHGENNRKLDQARRHKVRALILRMVRDHDDDSLSIDEIRGQVIEMLADRDFWELLSTWEAVQSTVRKKIHNWAV